MRRTAARLSASLGVVGGFVGFAAQWALFREGNFSGKGGRVFIPFLGKDGVYTSTLIGTAWYTGVLLLLVGIAASAIFRSLGRRGERGRRGD